MDAETRKKVRNALRPYLVKSYSFEYRGTHYPLNFNPRKGICIQCSKKVGDEYINHLNKPSRVKSTHLHHLKYDDDNPLANTIELCDSCHNKITNKQTVIPLKEYLEVLITTGKAIRRRKIR